MTGFYLGADTHWLADAPVPLFVSHLRLRRRRTMPTAASRWALDSGAFTDVAMHGRFTTTPAEYVVAVRRYRDEVGRLDWASPQDHMCEPWVLARSAIAGTVDAAQRWTVDNYLTLRGLDDTLPIVAVLQGQTVADYVRHAAMYDAAGVDLTTHDRVGVGSVCRRQSSAAIAEIVGVLAEGFRLHGFGVKSEGLARYGWLLSSADSMAWSARGRRIRPCPVRGVASCTHCRHHALAWRARVVDALADRRPVQLALSACCLPGVLATDADPVVVPPTPAQLAELRAARRTP